MNNLTRCFDIATELENHAKRHKRKFDVTIEVIKEFTLLYKDLSVQNRLKVQEFLSDTRAGSALFLSSSALAIQAIDTQDSDWIVTALMTHVIEDFKKDYRENFLALDIIGYAMWRIDANFDLIWKQISPFVSEESSKYFVFKNLGEHLLTSKGLIESKVNGKTKFVKKKG
jgi:hypothetical protein